IGLYRINRDMTRGLINALEPHLPLRRSPLAIPNELKVLCALNFYAQGSYQKAVGVDCRLSIAQSTVSTFLQEVTCAINDHLLILSTNDLVGYRISHGINRSNLRMKYGLEIENRGDVILMSLREKLEVLYIPHDNAWKATTMSMLESYSVFHWENWCSTSAVLGLYENCISAVIVQIQRNTFDTGCIDTVHFEQQFLKGRQE
ncbi:hypothetical protein ALC62_15349, partial [Cyphomyrmex costatus]